MCRSGRSPADRQALLLFPVTTLPPPSPLHPWAGGTQARGQLFSPTGEQSHESAAL